MWNDHNINNYKRFLVNQPIITHTIKAQLDNTIL
jgi:hypothetical protein